MARTLPELPPEPRRADWPARRRFDLDWQKRLFDAGYAGMSWPIEYGGRGASPGEQLVYLEEMAENRAPTVGVNFVGLMHAGPTLMVEATPEQKAAHLPRILAGEEVWCQGFSEPNAGSDLASLRTRAVRDGEQYVVNGQKIWSSFAHVADWAEVLVRTDPDAPKHKGISWLMVDMQTPGITVRPIETALGSSEFCEIFFDEVRVPITNRVGLENDGWRVAMVTFGFERGTGFVGELMEARRHASDLAALAQRLGKWEDVGLRRVPLGQRPLLLQLPEERERVVHALRVAPSARIAIPVPRPTEVVCGFEADDAHTEVTQPVHGPSLPGSCNTHAPGFSFDTDVTHLLGSLLLTAFVPLSVM